MTGENEEQPPGWAIRLEAKLDVAIAQHGARLDEHQRDLTEFRTRLDKIEDRPMVTPEGLLDHEERLRKIESASYVTVKGFAASMLTVLSIAVALLSVLDRIMR